MLYKSTRSRAILEALEQRRLLSDAWGAVPQLDRQSIAVQQHPELNGAGESVAIIDTGIDYNNPLLGGGFGAGHRVIAGWNFVDNNADPMDTFGHGTEVAGVIGASEFDYNGARYEGIAPDCNLVALRVDAADDPVPDARIQQALQWVIDNQSTYNIVAVNISFGSGHYATTQTSSYSPQLATLKSMGVFVAAASGNGGVSEPYGVEYPAADPSVYSVGSVDQFDTISEFTERGPNLDLLAPGENVPTIGLDPTPILEASGTSFATPCVVGTVALMKQADPSLTVADIESIFSGGGKINYDGDTEFGDVTHLTFERLDVDNAIDLALARRPGPLGSSGDVATNGEGNSMAYDADGVLHMVYYDGIQKTLEYVTRDTNRGLSQPQRIDPSSDDVGGYVSLAIDRYNRPAVAYFDGTAGDLKFAHFNGSSWDITTIDSGGSVGLYPALIYDANNDPVISYFQKSRGDLRVASYDGTVWNIQTVDSAGVVGRSTSITMDKKTGELAIAYEDSTHGRLKVARNSGQGWTRGLVDNSTHGVTYTSIAFNANDQPAVSYYDIHDADLKYAEFNGSYWRSQKLATKGAQGLYTQLYFSSDGLANIFYYNRRNNDVVELTGTFGSWDASILQTGGGRYIDIAIDPSGTDATYSWFQPGAAKLRLADV